MLKALAAVAAGLMHVDWLLEKSSASEISSWHPMQELDLTGAREFVTKETAEELLAPLLAPGAKFTKARTAAFASTAATHRSRLRCVPAYACLQQPGSRAACVRQQNDSCSQRLENQHRQPPFPVLHSALPQIRFSTKSFGVDAAEVAARAIENIAGSLVDADMSDIIAGRPGAWRLGCRRCWGSSARPRLLLD